ncbi:MAG TPA: response regulator transcription factor [Bryobacteraceae bacterium]|nr:response regulator transcription factor [Bryobacteraceae bacterium]
MSTAIGNILVTDDDPGLRRVLRRTLDALGFEVGESPNGEQAIREIEAHQYHAVLLDVNMPGIGGIEACRRIRRKDPHLQILMLSVRDRESDKIEALDAGADDYITKPFSIPEIAARLRSAVRRSATTVTETEPTIVIGEIELDPARRIVRKAGAVLRLTPKEFDLLHYLMRHPGVPIAHGKLLHAVWGAEYGQELEYLRTFVHQLRRKLENDPSSPEYLLTELHFGYRFREAARPQ